MQYHLISSLSVGHNEMHKIFHKDRAKNKTKLFFPCPLSFIKMILSCTESHVKMCSPHEYLFYLFKYVPEKNVCLKITTKKKHALLIHILVLVVDGWWWCCCIFFLAETKHVRKKWIYYPSVSFWQLADVTQKFSKFFEERKEFC